MSKNRKMKHLLDNINQNKRNEEKMNGFKNKGNNMIRLMKHF